MNCNRCGKPSVYRSTLIVNGVSQTTNLCRDCAIKEGVFTAEPVGIFDDIFSTFANFLPFEKVENIVCPVCKTSLREFKTTQNLGCANCYETFRDEIANLVKRIAPFDHHKQVKLKQEKPVNKKLTKQEKIASLREEMKFAVSEERYEDAAKIKKQITKLEAENE